MIPQHGSYSGVRLPAVDMTQRNLICYVDVFHHKACIHVVVGYPWRMFGYILILSPIVTGMIAGYTS